MARTRKRLIAPRPWTHAEDEILRAKWGKVKTHFIASELKRSPSALKQRARKLDLHCERGYTINDLEFMKANWATTTAREVAETLGRTVAAVYRLAYKMGLPSKTTRWPDSIIEQVRKLHAEKLSDVAIAERLGMTRDQVHPIRLERLGLPANPEGIAEGHRKAVASQFRSLGIKSPAELRSLSYRKYAARNGWPEDLRPREVQILNVLAEQGPKTARELCEAIGMRTDRRNTKHGGSIYLMGNGPGGTYTATLIRRGLIFGQRQHTTGRGKGKNRLPTLYLITPLAINTREACLERIERNPVASEASHAHAS